MKHDRVTESQSVRGAVLRVYEVRGLVLSETAYRPSRRIPAHMHEGEAYFNFVLRGGLTEHCGRRTYEPGESALVFHAAEEVRSNRFHARPTRPFLRALWKMSASLWPSARRYWRLPR